MIFLDGTRYTRLIESIDGNLVTFKDIINNNYDKNQRSFCIRHDVDNGMLQNSINFAKVERHHNWTSTYFIKYTSPYFDFSQRFVDSCRALVDLGHDLALHVDIVHLCIKLRKQGQKIDVYPLLKKPLDFLRAHGFDIKKEFYFNSTLLIPILTARLITHLLFKLDILSKRTSENGMTGNGLFNKILSLLFGWECLLAYITSNKLPGVSCGCVAMKPSSE